MAAPERGDYLARQVQTRLANLAHRLQSRRNDSDTMTESARISGLEQDVQRLLTTLQFALPGYPPPTVDEPEQRAPTRQITARELLAALGTVPTDQLDDPVMVISGEHAAWLHTVVVDNDGRTVDLLGGKASADSIDRVILPLSEVLPISASASEPS